MNLLPITLLCLLLCATVAPKIINSDEIQSLFVKFMMKQLTQDELGHWKDLLDILRRPEPISTSSIRNSNVARMSLDCIACRSAAGIVYYGINHGVSDEYTMETLTVLCSGLGIVEYNVCYGAIQQNFPIISYIFRNTPELSPNTLCGLVLQKDTDPNACPYSDARFDWHVELPKMIRRVHVPITDTKPLKVAIITDAHIDPSYEPFGIADCKEPICCRKDSTPSLRTPPRSAINENLIEKSIYKNKHNFAVDLSVAQIIREQKKSSVGNDVGGKNKVSPPAGFWGDYRNCDSPIWAFDDVIDRIKDNHDGIDILYYIGDTIDHGIWETSYDLVKNSSTYLIEKIRKTFGDHVLVVPVVGNHDTHPANQFSPSSITAPKLNTTWLYRTLAEKWQFYLPDEAKATLLERGEFSILVRPGLRVISLNNNIAYRYNWWVLYDPVDGKLHLDWLVKELQKAEINGEKVHILAHIPPGIDDLTYTWTREYNKIVNRFAKTIVAQFNGHTHADEFKIFYDADGNPINVAWGAGGITTYNYFNLNYKIVDFNSNTFVPENIVNYIYNLTEANLTPEKRPNWFLLYDLKKVLEVKDLSPTAMNDVIFSAVTNKRELLDIYSAFYSKLSDYLYPKCDENCKLTNFCNIVITVLWDREVCNKLMNIYYSTKKITYQ